MNGALELATFDGSDGKDSAKGEPELPRQLCTGGRGCASGRGVPWGGGMGLLGLSISMRSSAELSVLRVWAPGWRFAS